MKELTFDVKSEIKEAYCYVTNYKDNYKIESRIETELTFYIAGGIFTKKVSNTFTVIDGYFVAKLI